MIVMPESKRRKPKNRPAPKSAEAAAQSKEASPTWYVAIMAGFMVVGVIVVLLRFILELDQIVLVFGLLAIAAGFMMTTRLQ